MTRLSTSHLVRAHLKHAPGAAFVVALLVVLLACALTVLPHLLSSIRGSALDERLTAMTPATRDLVASEKWISARVGVDETAAGGDRLDPAVRPAWGNVEDALQKIRAELPEPLRGIAGDPQYAAIIGPSGEGGRTMVAVDPLYDQHVTVTEGRLPQWDRSATNSSEATFEVIASESTAAALNWKVGETRAVSLGGVTAYVNEDGTLQESEPPKLTLVGVFAPIDPASSYWQQMSALAQPATYYDPFGEPSVTGYFYAAPASLFRLLGFEFSGAKYWFPVDTSAITESNAGQIAAQLRAFTAKQLTLDETTRSTKFAFQSGLSKALDTATTTNDALTATILIFVAGPCGVGIAVLLLGARMIVRHRAAALTLLAARGAKVGSRRALLGLEGLVIGVIPALAGAGIGVLLVRTLLTASTVPLFAPLVIALLVALAVFPAVALAAAAGTTTKERVDTRRSSRWRAVGEGIAVILAVVAVALTLMRGTAATAGGTDPLVTVTPLLLTIAVALITLRLYPRVVALVHRSFDRTGTFTSFLGSARAVRESAGGAAALLSLLVGISIAVSSTVVLSSIESSASHYSNRVSGSDITFTSPRFDATADADKIAGLAGVQTVLPVRSIPNIAVVVGTKTSRVSIYAVDTATWQKLAPQAGVIPAGLSLVKGEAVPMIASHSAAERLGIGTGEVTVGGTQDKGRANILALVDDAAPFAANPMWLLVDASRLGDLTTDAGTITTIFTWTTAGADQRQIIDEVTQTIRPASTFVTAQSAREAVTSGAASAGLTWVLLGALALVALLCAIAIVLTLVLGAPARARLLALLKTLGARPSAGSRIVAWEIVPLCIAAIVSGVAFGLALPLLLFRIVDLRPFSGAEVPYVADPLVLAAAVGGFIVLAGVFVVVSLLFARRVKVTSVLRTVEDA